MPGGKDVLVDRESAVLVVLFVRYPRLDGSTDGLHYNPKHRVQMPNTRHGWVGGWIQLQLRGICEKRVVQKRSLLHLWVGKIMPDGDRGAEPMRRVLPPGRGSHARVRDGKDVLAVRLRAVPDLLDTNGMRRRPR